MTTDRFCAGYPAVDAWLSGRPQTGPQRRIASRAVTLVLAVLPALLHIGCSGEADFDTASRLADVPASHDASPASVAAPLAPTAPAPGVAETNPEKSGTPGVPDPAEFSAFSPDQFSPDAPVAARSVDRLAASAPRATDHWADGVRDISSPRRSALNGASPGVPATAFATPSDLAAASVFPNGRPRLPGGQETVRVYYGTNRERSEEADGLSDPDGFYTDQRGPLEFGILEVSIPGCHESGAVERPSVWKLERESAVRHVVLQRLVPVDEGTFCRELRTDVARDARREAFVFVHGFNVEFAEAAWRVGQMKADLDFAGPAVMYAWPSHGMPDPINYLRDQRAARKSRGHLMRFLETVALRSGADRIHVIAHSMGNELLVPALAALREDPRLPTPLFQELILAAPDIDADVFRDTIAAKLERAAERTTIYASDHDAALLASVALNNTLRLGLTRGVGGGVGDYPFLDIVDASPIEFRFFELGHSDYGGPLLQDVKATLAGEPTTRRHLAPHKQIRRGWLVVEPTRPDPQPVAKTEEPGLWASLTGWWPF